MPKPSVAMAVNSPALSMKWCAGAAGDFAQAEPVGTDLIQGCHRSLQQCPPQIAGEVFAHAARGAWPQAGTPGRILD